MGGYGAKKRSAIYSDRNLSGMLKIKVPLYLRRGGLAEVGLGKDFWSRSGFKREGAGKGGSWKRMRVHREDSYMCVPYHPLSSAPPLLRFHLPFTDIIWYFIVARHLKFMVFIQRKRKSKYPSWDAEFQFWCRNFGIPIEVATGSDSNSWERPSTVEAEVDYVRIYQTIKSIPLAEEAI